MICNGDFNIFYSLLLVHLRFYVLRALQISLWFSISFTTHESQLYILFCFCFWLCTSTVCGSKWRLSHDVFLLYVVNSKQFVRIAHFQYDNTARVYLLAKPWKMSWSTQYFNLFHIYRVHRLLYVITSKPHFINSNCFLSHHRPKPLAYADR